MSRLRSFSLLRSAAMLTTVVMATVFLIGALQNGQAQSRRVDSRSLTCAQVQSMIAQRGAVLFNTGPHTFDRYVSNLNNCQRGEVLLRENIPTKDTPHCGVRRCGESFFFRRD